MGEEADWIVDNLLYGWQHQDDWGEESRPPPTCKYCGCEEVEWSVKNDKWVLVDEETGERHRCSTDYIKTGFEDET